LTQNEGPAHVDAGRCGDPLQGQEGRETLMGPQVACISIEETLRAFHPKLRGKRSLPAAAGIRLR